MLQELFEVSTFLPRPTDSPRSVIARAAWQSQTVKEYPQRRVLFYVVSILIIIGAHFFVSEIIEREVMWLNEE